MPVRKSGSRRRAAIGLALGALLAMPSAATAALDGSTPILCSLASLMECDTIKCERITAEDADVPSFVRVDVPRGMVTAVPGSRQTPIKSATRLNGRLILQGGESGRGWSATIAEDSGKMAIAVADQDHAFVIFGACVAP